MQIDLRCEAGVTIAGEPPLQVAASAWLPARPQDAPFALVCLPGGNMNRRYYDLRPDGSDDSFSFAAQMTARGFVVLALDYLGLGESSKPADGYALTPELLMRANTHVTGELLARLHEGRLDPSVPALPRLRSIGIGHSMGAMMTILQQAATGMHAAVALLGFSTRGLPEYVSPEVAELARESVAVRARLVELARKTFVVSYPVIKSSGNNGDLYGSAKVDPRGVAALKAATSHLLPVPAFLSMVPGNVAPEAAQIDVPVFLGIGERDMVGPIVRVPPAFSASPKVELFVIPETGHSHFLFPARGQLFDALAVWAQRHAK